MAGILAGSGPYEGIARDADLFIFKILDQNGQGSLSQALPALRWILEQGGKYNIKAVNLSIGTNDRKVSPALRDAVEALVRRGIVVVAAAGNAAPAPLFWPPPISNSIITVGAWEERKLLEKKSFSPFSASAYLPDLWAPSESILSVMAKDCPLGPSRTPVGNGYLLMSGTSMATPMATGAALLLLEKERRLTPFAVKRRLMLSSLPRQGLLSVDRVLE